MYALSFDQSGAKATSQPLAWLNGAANNEVPFPMDGYTPVLGVRCAITDSQAQTYECPMQAANNHIHFLNTPSSTAGQA